MLKIQKSQNWASIRTGALCCSIACLVSACSPRGEIVLAPQSEPLGEIETVLVATSREIKNPPEFYGEERSFKTNFAEFKVAVPPNRDLGTVKLPDPGAPDPKTEFLVAEGRRISNQSDFIKAMNKAIANDPARGKEGVLFVHGYNNSFAEGLYRQAQMQHDMGRHGAAVHFAWPSSASATNYLGDRDSALFSRDALEETISTMARSRARSFNLVAHSMGTFLLMDTLRSMANEGNDSVFRKLSAVTLMSADIDVEVFRRQAKPLLALGVPIYLLVSEGDRALFFSAKLRGNRARLGSVTDAGQLGGLDVTIVDLSQIEREEMLGHFKEANSPALIEFVTKVHETGGEVFDQGRGAGIIGANVSLVQGPGGVRLIPAPGW